MKFSSLSLAAAGAIIASGCHTTKQDSHRAEGNVTEAQPQLVLAPQPGIHRNDNRQKPAMMPRAVAYRMSGPYADYVPVNVNAAGDIVSYPAPTDLGPDSTPVDLGDGWWLDRRGVSTNSVFTRYTYADYRAMKSAPSLAQLKDAIIPGAKVSEAVNLPMTLSEAVADLAAAKASLPVFRLKE